MLVLRRRARIVSAVLLAGIAALSLQAAGRADAAGRGGQGGFFDQLLSIFAPPAQAPAPHPQLVTNRKADPLYPYSGADKPAPRQSAAYRTVCVRLCDGYYWPVSEATTEGRFRRDSNVCQASCSQEAKLYYAPQGDSDASQFVGLDGKPYSELKNAFLYRKALQPQCQCKPDPWSETEILRHKMYAELERPREPQVAMSLAPPVTASDDPAPPAEVAGQAATVADVAADGAIAAYADPAPVMLRPTSDAQRPIAVAAKPKRVAKPARQPQMFSDPLSFSVETVDRGSHRYIPRR